MWVRLLCVLLLMLSGMARADLSAGQLHAVRIEAFGVCSHLLAFYNPNQEAPDQRHAERYRQGMQRLQKLVEVDQGSSLARVVDEMARQIDGLEATPADQQELYAGWITPLLMAHARLDKEVARRYAKAPSVPQSTATLHRLGLDIERFLLLYQARAFSLLGMYVMVVDDDTVPQLDARVNQGFADIRVQRPEHAGEILKLQRYYDYVRPRLLHHQHGWVPGSAAYYLGQLGTGLQALENE